jgi:drug/metabolite transporter (DMT)-like permease
MTLGPNLFQYIGGCAALGILCSWLSAFLWNKASLHLPVSLVGQLTLFETLFGLLFVYTLEQHLPPQMEFFGIVFMVAAIAYAIRSTSKSTEQETLVHCNITLEA